MYIHTVLPIFLPGRDLKKVYIDTELPIFLPSCSCASSFFCSCVHVLLILLFLLSLCVPLLSSLSRISNARFFFFKEKGWSNDSRSLRVTRIIRACVHPLHCSFENMPQIQYSEKYFDDVHEYRYVSVSLCPSHWEGEKMDMRDVQCCFLWFFFLLLFSSETYLSALSVCFSCRGRLLLVFCVSERQVESTFRCRKDGHERSANVWILFFSFLSFLCETYLSVLSISFACRGRLWPLFWVSEGRGKRDEMLGFGLRLYRSQVKILCSV